MGRSSPHTKGGVVSRRRSARLPDRLPTGVTFERFVEEMPVFVDREDLLADLSRKILRDNPKRLYLKDAFNDHV
jgi:hypothetical protein